MSSTAPWATEETQVLKALGVYATTGLSNGEVIARTERSGPNTLRTEKKTSGVERLLSQFKNPVIITLLVATVVSGLLGEYVDALAIITIVFLNALIGYVQEARAEDAVEALKKLSAPRARVLRDAQVLEVPSSEVCVGDILVLEAGDYVPADARVLVANQLSVDEAPLTGESMPVTKRNLVLASDSPLADRKNMLFAGTAVTTGTARAVVTAIGMQTEIGHVAGMLETAGPRATPLQMRLEQVSSKLLLLCGAVVLIVALFGVIHQEKWLSILMTAISLSVAAIPEGLPTVVTLALALAVHRMAKRKAIVRHLSSVETLGSADVICTDKTGTLTTGKMRVRETLVFHAGVLKSASTLDDSAPLVSLIESSVLCSNASLSENGDGSGDPTEVALLYLARENSISLMALHQKYPRVMEWSFDSNRKRMSVAVQVAGAFQVHVKGAPESIISQCRLTEEQKADIKQWVEKLSSQGQRLLAVARRGLDSHLNEERIRALQFSDVERELEFLGLVAISDPPRVESIQAIKECKNAGIRVVMITGDHPVTAKAIAAELGIIEPGRFDSVLTGSELDQMTVETLREAIERTAVYARVSPEHKLKIIEAWKSLGHIVAMTGDGVNDAPALKAASIGVSMGKGGTEVARQASSMILADDHFATIVAAIEEGRAIYGNIRRTIQYLLSGNLAEILIMLGAAAMGWPAPLAPIHLLWINLVTDGFPSLALAAEPVPPKVLESSNRPSEKRFFDRQFYSELGFVGFMTAVMALAVYAYSLKYEDELTARTHVFSFLVFAELFRSFACRSETKTFFQMGPLSNLYHLVAVAIPITFQLALHHTGWFDEVFGVKMISWTECFVMLGLTLIPVTAIELRKVIRQKRKVLA